MLSEHTERQLGALRAKLVGAPDTSANLTASVVDQISTLYDREPQLRHANAAAVETLTEQAEAADWWGTARQHQRYVAGIGDSLLCLGWDDEVGALTTRIVTPDLVWAVASKANPARPALIAEARQREVPGTGDLVRRPELAWFWDVWDVRDQASPSFAIYSNDRRVEMTEAFGVNPDEWRGKAYPYRDEAGRPTLPYVLTHASACTGLWAPLHSGDGIVFGSLQVGLLWTAAVHGVLRASWDQRVLVNGRVRGGTTETVEGRGIRTVTPDPTMILQIDGEGATYGAWGASIDITKAEAFCRAYENRLAVHFGLSPADVVIESLNPASGASITVSAAGKRALRERQKPVFRRSDRQRIRIASAILRVHGISIPESGWDIEYPSVAWTPTERVQVASFVKAELDARLLDRVTAYQELHPGVELAEAERAIEEQDTRTERDQVAEQAANPTSPQLAPFAGQPDEDQDAGDDQVEDPAPEE
jgi:hypothetical protein